MDTSVVRHLSARPTIVAVKLGEESRARVGSFNLTSSFHLYVKRNGCVIRKSWLALNDCGDT